MQLICIIYITNTHTYFISKTLVWIYTFFVVEYVHPKTNFYQGTTVDIDCTQCLPSFQDTNSLEQFKSFEDKDYN